MSEDRHLEHLDPLFDRLDPPPGGLTALRARLADEGRRTANRRWMSGGAMAAAAAVAVLVLTWTVPPPSASDAPSALLREAMGDPVMLAHAAPTGGFAGVGVPDGAAGTTAVSLVVTGDDQVLYYRISSVATHQ
jgi:hypothetical protein